MKWIAFIVFIEHENYIESSAWALIEASREKLSSGSKACIEKQNTESHLTLMTVNMVGVCLTDLIQLYDN